MNADDPPIAPASGGRRPTLKEVPFPMPQLATDRPKSNLLLILKLNEAR